MVQQRHQFERFIDAVHRRMVVARVVEAIGVGCAVAALVQLVGAVGGLINDRGASGPSWGHVFVAVFGALCWGVIICEYIGKPARMRAGSEADRQLNLADLLSTALSLRASSALFASAVLAQADAKVSAMQPAAVKVTWFGRRAWGVIASLIAMAVLLTSLSVLGRSEGQSQRHARAGTSAIPAALADKAYVPGDRGLARSFGSDHPTGTDENDRNVVEADPAGAASRTAAGNANAADNTGSGGGAGMARGNPTQHSPTQNNSNGGTKNPGGTGESALGSGATGNGGSATAGGNSGTAGPAADHHAAPAWASAAWPGGRDAAQQAVRDGRICGDYAALVRAYFDR